MRIRSSRIRPCPRPPLQNDEELANFFQRRRRCFDESVWVDEVGVSHVLQQKQQHIPDRDRTERDFTEFNKEVGFNEHL